MRLLNLYRNNEGIAITQRVSEWVVDLEIHCIIIVQVEEGDTEEGGEEHGIGNRIRECLNAQKYQLADADGDGVGIDRIVAEGLNQI